MQKLLETISHKTALAVLAASALFIAGFLPALRILVDIWANSEDYNHAFLILPIIGYMIWTKRSVLAENSGRHAYPGLIMVALSTPLYIFSLFTQVNTLIFAGMFMSIVGVCIYLWGAKAVTDLLTPLLLMALLIPVPEQLNIKLTFPLQLKVSQISQIIVEGFGIPIFREGNIMTIPTRSFQVVEACSGIRSIVALLTLSIVMGYFLLKRSGSRLALAAASLPAAVFSNIVRVTAMILLFHFFKLDLTEGALHTVMGLSTFGLALFILFLIERLLERWETHSE